MWSLVPIFPTWTLFPGVLAAMAIESGMNDCESSYHIVLWASMILTILSATFFLYKLDSTKSKSESKTKVNFRVWSLLIYTFTNTAVLILMVGVNLACHGDGQTLLMCIYSGTIASLTIVLFGLLSDLKIKVISASK